VGLAATEAIFSPEDFKKRLLRWVVLHDQPFIVVESAEFRSMFQRGTIVPSADTIKRDIMKCHREEADRIGDRLCNAGSKISVTLDCWTSPNTKAFLGITAHYIDDNWILQSLLLDFVPLPDLHTGENLCEAFVATCDRFGILPKLLGVTTDNAANIDKLLVCLERVCHDRDITFKKKEQHVRCMAHVTNLAVQALLRELRAEAVSVESSLDTATQAEQLPCITKIRRSVVKTRSTPQRRNEFKSLCDASGTPRKELILDVRTRWNSTHAMIERACELRVPLSNLAKISPDLSELSNEEWELLHVVAQVLGVFKEVTQPLCADSYPTLNEAVQAYNHLLDDLEGFLGQRNEEEDGRAKAAIIDQCSPANKRALTDAIQAAHDKLRVYYSDTWARLYAISVILDPRFKADYYEANAWEPSLVAHSKGALLSAIEEYGAAVPQSDQTGIAGCSEFKDKFTTRLMKRRRVQKESEMDEYLRAPVADSDVDVLEWWKQNSNMYPCLARIARDYLAIPATSVPAERAFSGGADLVTDKRGSLGEDTIQACMCLGSWL
jgi:hypothetical protein